MRLLAALVIGDPGLGQVEPSAHGKVKRGAACRVVGQVLGTHDHLTVADLAQRAGILCCHADRLRAFLGQSGIIEDQHSCGRRVDGQQMLDACLVQGCHIPGGVGEQMLQALGRGSRHSSSDGVCGLMRQVRK